MRGFHRAFATGVTCLYLNEKSAENCVKQHISYIQSSKRGIIPTNIDRSAALELDMSNINTKPYAKLQLNISDRVEKNAKTAYFPYS